MALKILVTNDDGIDSQGLKVLVKKLCKYGDILVCAPKQQQSAKSHAIDISSQIKCEEVKGYDNIPAYAVDSTPADCVRYAYYGLRYDFDILFSGVNQGFNLGQDILYSGTVGAIFEAGNMGKKGIAVSAHYSTFSSADEYFEKVMDFVEKNKLMDIWNLYNINIPIDPKGIKITRQGGSNFDTFFESGEEGYTQKGIQMFESDEKKIFLDTSCVMNGYVSITPVTADRTAKEIYERIKNISQ